MGRRNTFIPRGAYTPLTAAQLDTLSSITPAIVADALLDAARQPQLFGLLSASVTNPIPERRRGDIRNQTPIETLLEDGNG